MTQLDPRIVGMTPAQITKKFVRENLTEEEAVQTFNEVTIDTRTEEFPVDAYSGEELLEKLEKIKSFVANHSVTESWCDEDNLCIYYSVPCLLPISSTEYYQRLWKGQLMSHQEELEERKEYERLHNKYGNAGPLQDGL